MTQASLQGSTTTGRLMRMHSLDSQRSLMGSEDRGKLSEILKQESLRSATVSEKEVDSSESKDVGN